MAAPLAPVIVPPQSAEEQNTAVKEDAAPNEKLTNKYTIQIASFKNKESAKKEARILKNNGFTALILPKGSYNVVCVGNFENKEKAEKLLTEIRKNTGMDL